jgi:hypothetical protein
VFNNQAKNRFGLKGRACYTAVLLYIQEMVIWHNQSFRARADWIIPVLVVNAIGQPPKDKVCLFGHLKNVVVLPSVGKSEDAFLARIGWLMYGYFTGERSMASQTGGGDVDG